MKKTLLSVLLLFTTIFYAQITRITTCGAQSFDLTLTKADFIGNLNPTETSVTYFLSEDDAIHNTNEIANPTKFYGAIGPSKIYGRIDNNGTIYTNYFDLSVLEFVTVTASHKPILCKGDTASLSIVASGGTGPYQYSLNGSAFTSTNYYSNLPAGVYSIKVKSPNTICPDASINYTITEPTPIIATNAIVNQNTLIVTATGGTSPYRYSLDGIDYQSSNVFSGKTPGTYNIRVSDSEGCGTVVRATILPPLGATAYLVKGLDCIENGTAIINVNATGGQAPYTYSINGFSYQASNIFNNLNAGTYSITVKDALNSVSNPFAITIAPLVSVSGVALATNATSCSNAFIMVHATSGQAPFYYSIDNGQTFTSNNTFNNLTPGNYNFFIKDSKGCFSSPLFNTVQPFVPLTATASSVPLTCSTGKTSLTIAATGGQSPYQYALNNGAYVSNNTYSNLGPGTYNIKVKEDNGCITTIQYIIESPNPVYADFIVDGQNLTINGQNGTAPYQYSVNSMPYQSNNVYTNLSPGHNYILIKDAKGCESNTFMVIIEDPNPLKASAVLTKELDCVSNATIEITASGGQAPYKYSINGGQTYQSTPVFTNVIAGSYSPLVKDAVAMITYANTLIITPPIAVTATITKGTTCGESDLTTITATGGKTPYAYSLDGSTFLAVNTISGLSAGTHTITVKDSNNCQATVTVVIEPASLLTLSISNRNVSCFQGNDGAIDIAATGGKTPYTYSIGGEYVSNNIFNSLTPGYYDVTVKDALGCISSSVVSIFQPDRLNTEVAISATYFSDETIGGKITLTTFGGAGSYTYTIKNNDTGKIQVENKTQTVYSGLRPGSYTVITKDANGCQIEKNNVTVPSRAPMIVSAESAPINCNTNNTVIKITHTGGIAPYLYSIDDFNFTANNTFTVIEARNYSVAVQDSLGLISRIDHVVLPNIPATITTDVTYKTLNDIITGEITVRTSGGIAPYTYTVTNTATGTNVYENTTSTIYSELAVGTYAITAKGANGCESEKKEVTIAQPASLLITAVNAPVSCINHTTLTINASGGTAPYTYRIFSSLSYTTSNIFTDVEPDTYLIEVKDAAGNQGQISYTVKPNIPLKVNYTKSDVTCYGIKDGSITATASGGIAPYTYSLNSGTFGSSNVFKLLTAGNYRITVRDAAGCLTSSSLVITKPDALALSATAVNTSTAISNDGQIIAIATGGTLPYTYTLRDSNGFYAKAPQIFNIFSDVAPGTYQLQMTDAKQCEYLFYSITVGTTATTLSAVTEVAPINCNAGSITINATGGTVPYQYSQDGISYVSSNVFNVSLEGVYSMYVKDAVGAIVSVQAVVKQETTLSIAVNPTSEVYCNGDNTGRISLTIKDGKTPYYVSLDNAPYVNFGDSKNGTFLTLSAGNHTIAVKDTYGCIATGTTIVTEPATSLITAVKVENQTVSITATGGTAPYNYAISPNLDQFSSNNVFSQLTPASYTVITSDLKGCTMRMDVVVDPPAPLLEGKNKLTIEFKPGQTLADLIIDGQNIKWYINRVPSTGKSNKTNEVPLPLTTVLVDGTTYYASQTINKIESTERLAVTAKSNGALSTSDFVLPNFKYYPNPVLHNLTIENSSVIDEIEIFSVSGQSILNKVINNDHSNIDLSNVSSGFYFLRVKSEGQVKTIKIVKK